MIYLPNIRILMTSPAVSQIDLNPVRMTEDGLVLLDALVLCG